MPMPKRMERRCGNINQSRMLKELFNVLRLQLNLKQLKSEQIQIKVYVLDTLYTTLYISLNIKSANSLSYRNRKTKKTNVEPEHCPVRLQSFFLI